MYITPIGAYDLPPFALYMWDASLSLSAIATMENAYS
jgi:hypothetical protein